VQTSTLTSLSRGRSGLEEQKLLNQSASSVPNL